MSHDSKPKPADSSKNNQKDMLRSTFLLLRLRDREKGFEDGVDIFFELAYGIRKALRELSEFFKEDEDEGKEEIVLGKDGKPIVGHDGKPMGMYGGCIKLQ
ncbi:MAG: hypothetical protein JRN67_07745, partial [Nitrososphaerota archaeon]|nr:hypothetical protein [Nitrososphaerota archaeon]